MKVAPLVISVFPKQREWVNKVSKEMKSSAAEVIRHLIDDAMLHNPAEFKSKLEKTKLQSMLAEIEQKQDELQKQKVLLEAKQIKLA